MQLIFFCVSYICISDRTASAFKSTPVLSRDNDTNRQSYNGNVSIFASAPKVEPMAPPKKKVKIIESKKRPKNTYMQPEPESSVLEGSKEVIVPESKFVPSVTVPSNAKPIPLSPATAQIGLSEKPGGDDTHTDYEEAERKTVEYIEDPHHIAGLKAKGPLAPDHIPAQKFKHRGHLVLKKRSKVTLVSFLLSQENEIQFAVFRLMISKINLISNLNLRIVFNLIHK